MHSLVRAKDIRMAPAFVGHSAGFARFSGADRSKGSVHTNLGLCTLTAEGRVDTRVQSFEETFYVLEGEPILILGGDAVRLKPGACGVVPIGAAQAWRGDGTGTSRWIYNRSPHPREEGETPDVFWTGAASDQPARDLDIRDPRSRHLFMMRDADIDLKYLQSGSKVNAPTVSASMATAVLAYSGIAVKMLVDQRMGAAMSTMFMVEYQPGAVAHPHDHPLEEAYVMLDGVVDAVADGQRYTLGPGDILWTGVGCIHAFYEVEGKTVRWLETASPQPPAQHSYRFTRDWDYLQQTLAS